MKRAHGVLLVFVVAAGWLLRAWPALAFGDWWWVPVDYDDAVYFSASAMLWEGAWPYRDFVFVHPPGILLFLAPMAAAAQVIGPADAFSLARWAVTLVGATNIALAAALAHRVAGPVAGVAAGAAYALFPEIVTYERNPYLEPFLNVACLLLAHVWLSDRVERRRSWAFLAGACLGVALMVKLWALVWMAACVASTPSRRALGWLAAGAAAAIAAIAGTFLLASPAAFVEQTVLLQAWRPPDGMPRGVVRLGAMVRLSGGVAAAALIGLVVTAWGGGRLLAWRGAGMDRSHRPAGQEDHDRETLRSARFLGTAWILLAAAFAAARTYWPEYNAHLAAAAAPLAGIGVAWSWRVATARGWLARVALAAILVAAVVPPLRHDLRMARVGGNLMEEIGRSLRTSVPADACYVALEPAWALAADRLPSRVPGGAPLVDVYGTMLLAARDAPRHDLPQAQAALWTRPAQRRIRELLAGCDYLSLGARGDFQLTPATRTWIERRWEKIVDPQPGDAAVDLWRLRPERAARRGSGRSPGND
jgi:hypothetical protein